MFLKTESSPKLHITLQTLVDRLEAGGLNTHNVVGDTTVEVVGFQLYETSSLWRTDILCLCTADQLLAALDAGVTAAVVVGVDVPDLLPINASVLILEEPCSLLEAANGIQKVFTRYLLLERRINSILYGNGNLEELAQLILEHLGNPVFVHDEHFNILACPRWVEGMSIFSFNQQTGKLMQDLESINYFRASEDYKKTLATRGGQWWMSGLTNFKTIYSNIWQEHRYLGRVVVNELEQPIRESHLFELGFFGELAGLLLAGRHGGRNAYVHPGNSILRQLITGNRVDREVLKNSLALFGWDVQDPYMCGIFVFAREEVNRMSIYGICNGIEQGVPGSHAFAHEEGVYMIVNLAAGKIDEYGVRKRLSPIIREGLFHAGLSSPLRSIAELPTGFKQAFIALEYGQRKDTTSWFHSFKEHAVSYWLAHGAQSMEGQGVVSPALYTLLSYDEEHNSALYTTLKVFLQQERNATATAQILDIHRSTLPHRLERIAQLTGLDLDHGPTRLYLLMSFQQWESAH